MRRSFTVALVAVCSSAVHAQTFDPAVASMRAEWAVNTANIRKAAEQIPEADFAYRPVSTVRTFGQVIGHVIDAQFSICADALAEKNTSGGRAEQTVTSKGELLRKLNESTALCAKAYEQNIATLQRAEQTRRYGMLAHNAAHNAEHYGNIVTYMRMKGLVPPSSQH